MWKMKIWRNDQWETMTKEETKQYIMKKYDVKESEIDHVKMWNSENDRWIKISELIDID